MTDEEAMRRAIALADRAAAAGDVPVGALLTLPTGETIEGWNEREARPDPTAHAEILVLREAARRLRRWRLSDATLYVTKEPCPMCAGAVAGARVRRLVYGCRDPKGGAAGSVIDVFASAAVHHRVEVVCGLLAEETAAQLTRYFRAKRRGAAGGAAPGATGPDVL